MLKVGKQLAIFLTKNVGIVSVPGPLFLSRLFIANSTSVSDILNEVIDLECTGNEKLVIESELSSSSAAVLTNLKLFANASQISLGVRYSTSFK